MSFGKTVELFLVNGRADSIVIAELMNWNGKAFRVPRIEFFSSERKEFRQAGVYFLFGSDDMGDTVYIGEAENVKERLKIHVQSDSEERNSWNTVVFFTGDDLNKTLLRYLENRFVSIANECRRYRVLTKNTYSRTVIKESYVAAMEEFLENARLILGVLGYRLLEPVVEKSAEKSDESQLFHLRLGNVDARGLRTPEGFAVLKDSTLNEKVNAYVSPATLKKRDICLKEGKIDCLRLTEDILFTSPSAAAQFLLGYQISGPQAWKRADGRTLKEIESEESSN